MNESEKLKEILIDKLESDINIIEKIVEVLVNSEEYRNSQRLLNLLDRLNKISVSW